MPSVIFTNIFRVVYNYTFSEFLHALKGDDFLNAQVISAILLVKLTNTFFVQNLALFA
jgi:hypothetical protein